jgi:myo-inositol 2-dehydrogenase/D-chiro-inositol 1-dehydrogenase
MGAIHGRNAASHPLMRLRCIVDPDRAQAEALAHELGADTASLDDVLSDRTIAGVIVASPTDAHLEHSLRAIEAGKSVFCEKPVGLDLAAAQSAARAFAAADDRFFLGFNRRFDPHIRALKAKLAGGAVGRLETLTIINHDPAPPPPAFIPRSGGLFKDFTIHDLDLAAWLLDETPCEVFAAASCLVDPAIAAAGDVDTAKVILKTPTGRLCMISNTRRSGYGYDQRIEAFGAGGMVAAANVRADAVQLWSEDGEHRAPILPDFLRRYAASYGAEMDHFADITAGKAVSEIRYRDGVAALAMAEAAAESSRINAPVRL